MPTPPILAAAIQLQGRPGAFDANLEQARRLALSAIEQGARLLALPEFFPSPILFDEPFASPALDALDNPALALMRELAGRHGVSIGGSMVVSVGEQAYNRYYFIEPDGRCHHHDKDLPTMWENCFYDPGQDDGAFDTQLGGVGAAMCWELIRNQTVRRLRGRVGLAMTGNHWWTIPANWPLLTPLLRPVDRINRRLAEQAPVEFARRLGVPVLHAAHCGGFSSRFLVVPGQRWSVPHRSAFVGATQIVSAEGEVLARRHTEEGPGLVLATVTPGAVAPRQATDPQRFWMPPDLTVFHRAYWHHQNRCGKAFRRRQRRTATPA
ncbi:MAG TPA: carbon-nitrogen hydrolase family protein [Nevskiaceae bacterium]|nr:carbon-nitrogen hydrolase family protein [Nevskiaceae bacterium]